MIKTIKKAFLLLDKHQRHRWYRLIPLALITALFEIVAVIGIYYLIRIFSSPDSIASADLYSKLPDWKIISEYPLIISISVLISVLFIVKNSLRLFESYLRELYTHQSAHNISRNLLSYYLAAPYHIHHSRNSSELIRNIQISSGTVSQNILSSTTAAVTEAFVIFSIVAVLIFSAPIITLLATVTIGGLMLILLGATQRYHSIWGRKNHRHHKSILQILQQSLGGIKEIKILGKENYFLNRFSEQRSKLALLESRRGTLSVVPRLTVETIFVVSIMLLIISTETMLKDNSEIIALVGLFAYAGFRLLPSFHLIVYYANNIRFGAAALDDIAADYVASKNVDGSSLSRSTTVQHSLFKDSIEFTNVNYCYPGTSQNALTDINIHISKGKTIGVVGVSGAGKSTFIDLLLGLIEPDSGAVKIDGKNLQDKHATWQSNLGYVPQTLYLIDDSIRKNIALGFEDENIDDERIKQVLKLVRLDSFVEQLPQYANTLVGEDGIRLSGGQRQRIAIARALYSDPEVLIFDEATAALDNRTEQELTDAIDELRGVKTIILVAHRMSTVQNCDELLLFDKGRLNDVGDFKKLNQSNKLFQQISGNASR